MIKLLTTMLVLFTAISAVVIFLGVRSHVNEACSKESLEVDSAEFKVCVLENTPTGFVDSSTEYLVALISGK